MKKNNKGFSLVELIVVVLIMGIIAVALAPQVIKWVEKSRKASDASAYDEMVEEFQVALVNQAAYNYAGNETVKIYICKDGVYYTADADASPTKVVTAGTILDDTLAQGTGANAAGSGLNALFAAVYKIDPKWWTVKAKASAIAEWSDSIADGEYYQITINKDRSVARTYAPVADTDDN